MTSEERKSYIVQFENLIKHTEELISKANLELCDVAYKKYKDFKDDLELGKEENREDPYRIGRVEGMRKMMLEVFEHIIKSTCNTDFKSCDIIDYIERKQFLVYLKDKNEKDEYFDVSTVDGCTIIKCVDGYYEDLYYSELEIYDYRF